MFKKIMCAVITLALLATAMPAAVYARDDMKNTDPDKYYILLDVNNQFVTVYGKDNDGKYTKVVRRFLCSSGKRKALSADPEDKATPTPAGKFRIGAKERFGLFAEFGGEYARYWSQIIRGIYFHSIMYGSRNVNSLMSGPFRHLGNTVSHGCVRLYVEDAKWIYYYCPTGTVVNVSYSEPKQPQIVKALRSDLSFSEYNALQKGFYDTDEQPDKTAWVSVDNAEVRTGNGTNDEHITNLKKGTAVEVIQEGDPWVKVIYDAKKKSEGYIKLAFLTYQQGVMQSKSDADIIIGTTYVYSKAGGDNKYTMFQLPDSTSVKVLATGIKANGKKWTQIETNGKKGYVLSSRLRKGWGTIRS